MTDNIFNLIFLLIGFLLGRGGSVSAIRRVGEKIRNVRKPTGAVYKPARNRTELEQLADIGVDISKLPPPVE